MVPTCDFQDGAIEKPGGEPKWMKETLAQDDNSDSNGEDVDEEDDDNNEDDKEEDDGGEGHGPAAIVATRPRPHSVHE